MDHQIWIIDDDKNIRWVLERALNQAQLSCRCFESAEQALTALSEHSPAVIVTDQRLHGMSGVQLIARVHAAVPGLPVILMTAYSDLNSAVSAYDVGAFEYLPKPFDIDDAVSIIKRALSDTQNQPKPSIPSHTTDKPIIIGEGAAMQEVYRMIGRLAKTSATVLVTGESGTGKELVAKALHQHSHRKDKPFIAINMAALPGELVESELFGHEKGAFTGATQLRKGRFEQAHGGTLFLDEIGDMPFDTQTRLLRVLSEGNFYRVGGHSPIEVDVRIIAATHQNIEQLTKRHAFREDLFHRLNVIRMRIPPLRERVDDIPELARHFLASAAKEFQVAPKVFADETMAWMQKYAWSGNVRQLENVCRYVTVMSTGRYVMTTDLPPDVIAPLAVPDHAQEWQDDFSNWVQHRLVSGEINLFDTAINEMERIMIDRALHFTQYNKSEAAVILGVGRNTLTRKIQQLALE